MISEEISLNSGLRLIKDSDLLKLTLTAAKNEKEATLQLLSYLVEGDERRLYATIPYPNLFQYIVIELGFSESVASERLNTVRLMRSVSEVKNHLVAGTLSVSNAAQIQRFIRTEEKVAKNNKSVAKELKIELVNTCLGQSKREVQKILLSKHSEPAQYLVKETEKLVTSERTELKFTLSEDGVSRLKRAKELIGNKSLEEIFLRGLDVLINQEEKKRGMNVKPKKITPPAKSVNSESVNSESVNSESVNSESVNSKSVNSKSVNSKSVNSKSVNSKSVNSKSVNSKSVNSKSVNIGVKQNFTSTKPEKTLETNSVKSADRSVEYRVSADDETIATGNIETAHHAEAVRNIETFRNTNTAQNTQRSEAISSTSRFIPMAIKRYVFERSQGSCEFVNSKTSARCNSKFRLQIDHIVPLALGGKTDKDYLRHLCSNHNLWAASEAGLGFKH